MKKYLLLTLLFGSIFNAFSQVETTVWKGKTYFVYPHQLELNNNMYLFAQYAEFREVLKRDDKNRKVIGVTVEKNEKNEELNYYGSQKMTKERKKQEHFIRELLNKKPELFYQYSIDQEQDITPSLEVIPDGEYIQYFRDLPYLDNTTLRFKNDVVAGIFTIKNNQLEGSAVWYTATGLIMKTGSFSQGSREGNWNFYSFVPKTDQLPVDSKEDAIIEYLTNQTIIYDTLSENYAYLHGIKNGNYLRRFNERTLTSGVYTNNKETGSWEYYEPQFMPLEDGSYRRSDTLILTRRYTLASKPIRGKSIIIRDEVIDRSFLEYEGYNYYDEEPTTESDTSLVLYNQGIYGSEMEEFSVFYSVLDENDTIEEGLELPEEGINSYEGAEFNYENEYPGYDAEYYDGEGYESDMDYQPGDRLVNGKYYSRNELIDSLGYKFEYEGVYEEFYANGQLKIRFEIIDGVLQKEDTVFWDNGQAANTVVFNTDSSRYEQHFFDYKGKLYQTLYYDEKGELIKDSIADSEEEYGEQIDGLIYYFDEGMPTLSYTNREKLANEELTERTLIQAARWAKDQRFCMTGYLDPATATLDYIEYSILGDEYYKETAVFGDDYQNVNAVANQKIGALRLETTSSGSLYDFSDLYYRNQQIDTSLPQLNALYWNSNYETSSDALLYQNNQLFSGTFKLEKNASKFQIKSSETSVNIQLPTTAKEQKMVRKALKKFYKKGKRNAVLELYDRSIYYAGIDKNVMDLFPFISSFFNVYDNDYKGKEYMNYESMAPRVNSKVPVDKTIQGAFLNGKPEGEWLVKDQFGQITTQLFFQKGELEGELIYYSTEMPITQSEQYRRNEYIAKYNTMLFEASPEKKVRYISRKENYKNGKLNGPMVSINWQGDTTSYSEFRDGYQNGISIQRNKFFYAAANYEDGYLDGISRTYLTVPGRDSILIFDLNFQNNALQGESKTYHTNGKIAKRGFFLSGQPIDDYEAYDTLGFKYQYVKFLYNQPVEEKIWEENQLSVRYQFDWKDSIFFDISDIAGSSSFERLAVDMGLVRDPYGEPYYGRPSLVDKTGINYSIVKYYPNDTIAREGTISKGKKIGLWKYFNYDGLALCEVNYFDSIISINDSVRFKSKGILTYFNDKHQPTSKSYIIEKVEKYDCSHADHNEERMLYAFWEADSNQHRINGYVKNYYDNGAIQNEGNVVNGLPTGVWKMYDSDGQLNQVGNYKLGKRDGRWLRGDLGNVKNMGEICLNPNLDNLEEIIAYQEKLLDISVIYYQSGVVLKREYYGINMNNEDAPDGTYREEDYYRE